MTGTCLGVVGLGWVLGGGSGGGKRGRGRFFFGFADRGEQRAPTLLFFSASLSLFLSLSSCLGCTLDAAAMPKQLQLQSMMMLLARRRTCGERVKRAERERERESIDGCSLSSPNASFLSRPRRLLSFPFKKRSLLLSIPLSLFAVDPSSVWRRRSAERETEKRGKEGRRAWRKKRKGGESDLFLPPVFSPFILSRPRL